MVGRGGGAVRETLHGKLLLRHTRGHRAVRGPVLTNKAERSLSREAGAAGSHSLREREFISLYETALLQKGRTAARVKKENKTPRRKKATLDDSKDG